VVTMVVHMLASPSAMSMVTLYSAKHIVGRRQCYLPFAAAWPSPEAGSWPLRVHGVFRDEILEVLASLATPLTRSLQRCEVRIVGCRT
jgi:hypothetical protein